MVLKADPSKEESDGHDEGLNKLYIYDGEDHRR